MEIADFRERNLVFVDIETTGLNPELHEITEIGALVVEPKNFRIVKEYSAKVRPEKIGSADPEALELTGYSEKSWREARSLDEVLREFNEISPGGILIGYNFTFDWSFLERAFLKCKITPNFDYHRIDVMSIAYFKILDDPEAKELRLSRMCERFGIRRGREHSALEDARATYKLFLKLMKD